MVVGISEVFLADQSTSLKRNSVRLMKHMNADNG